MIGDQVADVDTPATLYDGAHDATPGGHTVATYGFGIRARDIRADQISRGWIYKPDGPSNSVQEFLGLCQDLPEDLF
jgi:hypothetical protein